jgi:general secretion pathway protein L
VPDVVGIALREDGIECAVVRRRFRSVRVVASFTVGGDQIEPALRAKLRELRVRTKRVHVGIPRRRAVVKAIELPAVAGADLRRMVGFELERHLPFPAADAIFDFHVLAETPGQPVRVLLVAVERRVFERVAELVRDAGLAPRLVDVTLHGIAALLAGVPGAGARDAHVVLHLEDAQAELAVVRLGRPVISRAFPLPPESKERSQVLGDELRRTLAALRLEDREAVTEVTVTGDRAALPGSDWAELPMHFDIALPSGIGSDAAAHLPAVAMALRQPNRGVLRTNLMPEALRPRPFPWPVATTAALAVLSLLLALAIPGVTALRDERRLQALEQSLQRLAPDVRQAEQLAGATEAARREVETLRGFDAQHVRALPVLRELTDLLPADVWLTNLSIDRKGVELSGFANSASQLIPMLEASPTFERVEFTSPVTKGRDREQFRLKASWERPPGRPAPAPPARPGAPAPPARRGQPGGDS